MIKEVYLDSLRTNIVSFIIYKVSLFWKDGTGLEALVSDWKEFGKVLMRWNKNKIWTNKIGLPHNTQKLQIVSSVGCLVEWMMAPVFIFNQQEYSWIIILNLVEKLMIFNWAKSHI